MSIARNIAAALLIAFSALSCAAQEHDTGDQHLDDQCAPGHPQDCLRDILHDQKAIWTSPAHMHGGDLEWLLPLAGVEALAVHFDRQALDAVGQSQARVNFGTNASRLGAAYTVAGTSAAFYLVGHYAHHQRMRATGVRGLEAMADALIVVEAGKLAFQRDRPTQDQDAEGEFWPHGFRKFNWDGSMPSGHSAETWAFVHVVASEYSEKKWVGVLAYSAGILVSTSRVLARKHFPSDVVAGGAIGYVTGGYVVRERRKEVRRRLGLRLTPIMDPATQSIGLTLGLAPAAR
ncbi:MAG TPA: phosphatase PAP2 family protein [Terriglobales bacterium]|nr:phosphatase PAP2 family protein [Terriglobales bacterium]